MISILCSLFVISTYWLLPELRRHPAGIVVSRAVFDSIFAGQFVALYIYGLEAEAHCTNLAVVFQVSIFASLSYYFIMAVDLYLSLNNPFVAAAANNTKYHFFVIVCTIFTALFLYFSDAIAYREGFELCWIKVSGGASSANPYNWGLFFGPVIIFLLVTICIWIYATYRLSVGLQDTFNARKYVVHNLRAYVISFAVYWLIVGSFYIPALSGDLKIYDATTIEAKESIFNDYATVFKIFAIILGLRGLPDAIVWFKNQKLNAAFARWLSGADAPRMHTDINTALRKEVLVYTTRGICGAIEQARNVDSKIKMDPRFFPKGLLPSSDEDSSQAIVSVRVLRNEVHAHEDASLKGLLLDALFLNFSFGRC